MYSDPDNERIGVEYRVRASPTANPEELTNQLVAQLVPYLRQIFSQYSVVYRIRVIVQPVFVKTPRPPITVSVVTRNPISGDDESNDEGNEEEAE